VKGRNKTQLSEILVYNIVIEKVRARMAIELLDNTSQFWFWWAHIWYLVQNITGNIDFGREVNIALKRRSLRLSCALSDLSAINGLWERFGMENLLNSVKLVDPFNRSWEDSIFWPLNGLWGLSAQNALTFSSPRWLETSGDFSSPQWKTENFDS
jgi:hypothetical protein